MKLTLSITTWIILVSAAVAWGFGAVGGGSTAPNMTIFDQSAGCNGNLIIPTMVSNPGLRVSSPTALTPSEKTFIHLDIGDSLSSNTTTDAVTYTATNTTKNQNFNIYSGLNYQFLDPLLSAAFGPGGSWGARLNDKLIDAGKFARSIAVTVGIGGTCSQDWAPGGPMYHHAVVACLYFRRLGWPVSGSGDSGNWRFAILYALGVNDNVQGVGASAFTANARAFAAGIRAYGCMGDIFVARSTLYLGVPNVALQGAQTGLVDGSTWFTGADRDAITANPSKTDGTHLTGAGNNDYAADLSPKIQMHY